MALNIPTTPTVEATSLASVLELAANPPDRPTRTSFGIEPLVLYIARVPGSRDVFLTPIKPREKVVTASDVQSSLYYLHCHQAKSDYEYSQPNGSNTRPSSVNTNASNLPTMTEPQSPRRKAVPGLSPRKPAPPVSPLYPLDDEEKPALPPRQNSTSQKVERKPLLPSRSPARDKGVDLPVLPPRPLPPPPPQDDEDQPPSPSRSFVDRRFMTEAPSQGRIANPPSFDQPTEPTSIEPGTLTLIRRNPGSSDQWNVATIHDPPVQEVSSASLLMPTAKRRTKKGGRAIWLEISNPTYRQFAPTESDGASATGSKVSLFTHSSEEASEPPSLDGANVFKRRLYMPGSQYAEHTYAPKGHNKYGSVSSTSDNASFTSIPSSLRGDRHSVDLGSLHAAPRADKRSKGYTFLSPWNTKCEFTTGATGTTLKCRHYFTPSGISSNGPEASTVLDVSELRFNLPTKSASQSSSGPRSYFSHQRHLSEDGSERLSFVMDENGRIDLSLGQEKAGGGFGGKQAKLGKLIVEPAGFGMLDLLVAANLGLWWRGWERA